MQSKLLILHLLLATTGAGYLLPDPLGKYNVTVTTGAITDDKRGGRELMLSVFQPATCASTAPIPYMPNKTAEHEAATIARNYNFSVDLAPLFSQARQPVCLEDFSPQDDTPVLLLCPGYRGSRLQYNFLAASIASEGFTVISMDHPGETSSITYPNGTAANVSLPNPTNIDDETPYAYARAADAIFVIDQLITNTTTMAKLLPRRIPAYGVVMAGHSIGGSAAVLAADQDSRIRSVINWDGPFFGALPRGLSQPVLYVGTKREEPRFTAIWPKFNGPNLWVEIADLVHEGMTDAPTLLQASGQNSTGFTTEWLGTLAPKQSVKIMTAYTTE